MITFPNTTYAFPGVSNHIMFFTCLVFYRLSVVLSSLSLGVSSFSTYSWTSIVVYWLLFTQGLTAPPPAPVLWAQCPALGASLVLFLLLLLLLLLLKVY